MQKQRKEKKLPSLQARNKRVLPSILVSSGDIDLEIFTPAGTKINSLLISVHVDLLKEPLNKKEDNILLKNIISGN